MSVLLLHHPSSKSRDIGARWVTLTVRSTFTLYSKQNTSSQMHCKCAVSRTRFHVICSEGLFPGHDVLLFSSEFGQYLKGYNTTHHDPKRLV